MNSLIQQTQTQKRLTVAGGRDGVVRELSKVTHTAISNTDNKGRLMSQCCVSAWVGPPVWGENGYDVCVWLSPFIIEPPHY